MTAHKFVAYNSGNARLEVVQSGDTYLAEYDVQFNGLLNVTGNINGRDLAADGTKLDLVTVTQAVDLDALETRVDALNAAVVLKGTHDASTNLFPVSTVAGESWIVSVTGTINGIVFDLNDRIVALVDGASTTIYAANWHKLDYTDEVLSVAGRTGAVVLVEADVTDLQAYMLPVDIDTISKLNALVGETLLISGDTLNPIGVDFIDQTSAPAHNPGLMFYQAANGGGFMAYVEESDVTLNIGEEEWITVRNDTGVTIVDGAPVYISGISGGIPQISLVIADGDRVTGVATHSIEDGTIGKVTRGGRVTGPDFTGFAVGDTLYISPITPGLLINVAPIFPDTVIEVGTVVDNANPGSLNVDIEHHATKPVVIKSYNFSARTAASGIYYLGGYYAAPLADSNLSDGSPTQTYGTVNSPRGANAFFVYGGGSTNGSTITVTVTGTSIDPATGVRTTSDSEELFNSAVGSLTVNDYYETTLKWVGQITYTLTSDGGTFTCDFNYGFCKYERYIGVPVVVRTIDIAGLADANDAGFDVELLHHKPNGWTYHATAFVPGFTEESFVSDYSTDSDLKAGEEFAWDRSDLLLDVATDTGEGVLVRVTTSVNNSVTYMSCHIGAIAK